MNIITVSGNLTKDVDLRYSDSGKAMCFVDMANNQKFKDNEHVEYYKGVLFDKRAEALAPYLKKGLKITMVGEHRTEKREFEGKTYFNNNVRITEIDLHGSRSDSKPQQSKPKQENVPSDDFVSIPF